MATTLINEDASPDSSEGKPENLPAPEPRPATTVVKALQDSAERDAERNQTRADASGVPSPDVDSPHRPDSKVILNGERTGTEQVEQLQQASLEPTQAWRNNISSRDLLEEPRSTTPLSKLELKVARSDLVYNGDPLPPDCNGGHKGRMRYTFRAAAVTLSKGREVTVTVPDDGTGWTQIRTSSAVQPSAVVPTSCLELDGTVADDTHSKDIRVDLICRMRMEYTLKEVSVAQGDEVILLAAGHGNGWVAVRAVVPWSGLGLVPETYIELYNPNLKDVVAPCLN